MSRSPPLYFTPSTLPGLLTDRVRLDGSYTSSCSLLSAWRFRPTSSFALRFGEDRLSVYRSVERGLKAADHRSVLMRRACPGLFPDPEIAYKCFKMLKDARVGNFTYLVDDPVAADPAAPTVVH